VPKGRSVSGRERIAKYLVVGMMAAAAIMIMGFVLLAEEDDGPELAPQFILPNLDGTEVSLEQYLGSVVILDFWASWCLPCVRWLPGIHALQETYADQGVVLLLLCFDKRDSDAREYLLDHGYTTENVLWGSLNAAREVKDLFGIEAVTHAFVIDRDGYIRYSGHPEKLTAEVIEPWLVTESK
jgi:thiol-disulfide isomerase/thioredoxin